VISRSDEIALGDRAAIGAEAGRVTFPRKLGVRPKADVSVLQETPEHDERRITSASSGPGPPSQKRNVQRTRKEFHLGCDARR
jgi:hypothetical protein